MENSLQLLVPRKAVGSLAVTNTFDKEELKHFIFLRDDTSNKIYGTESVPGCMLAPSHKNVRMPPNLRELLCEWYSILYGKKRKNISEYMDLRMNQYARFKIGDEIFGSKIGRRYANNSIIRAKWQAYRDDSSDIYPGEVQYFFEHVLHLPDGPKTHLLAYVRWFKPASSSRIRFKHKFMENDEKSNTEIWKADYSGEEVDSIIAVHRIYSRAIKINYQVMKKNNYVSIIPLNRRFNV